MICKYCGEDSDMPFVDDFWCDDICTPCAEEKELIE